jgi:uncharacterized membrane protein YciS (DUF1049 family)
MVNRFLVFLLLVALVMVSFSLGCNSAKRVGEEYSMVQTTAIPLIDAAVPANMETATFALG